MIDAEIWPEDVAAWACSVTPGSVVLTALAAVDPRRLCHAGLIDYIDAWEKHCSWVQARQYRGLAELGEQPGLPGEQGKHWVREEVACALKLSFNTAASRPLDDTGMSGIWMLLPDAGATVLMTAIDALARRSPAPTPEPLISAALMPSSNWRWTPCTGRAAASCRASTACGPPSTSASPCPRCSVWTRNQVSWPAPAPSPPRSRGSWPRMRPGPGGG